MCVRERESVCVRECVCEREREAGREGWRESVGERECVREIFRRQLSSSPAELRRVQNGPILEATQGQIDGLFSQLPYKCHLEEVTSVGD